jgi:hypothetical protein
VLPAAAADRMAANDAAMVGTNQATAIPPAEPSTCFRRQRGSTATGNILARDLLPKKPGPKPEQKGNSVGCPPNSVVSPEFRPAASCSVDF